MLNEYKWKKLDGEIVNNLLETISLDIVKTKAEFADDEIKFYVGTDSQRKKYDIVFVTAIVLYRKKSGGIVYILKEREKHSDIRTRLWNETYKAITIATELNDFLKSFNLRVDEVHADLNPDPKHKSNSLVKSCLGYICGMGFEGKIKPASWAASKVANIHTK
jgi:predicted RNase H-related nuclease YkuK (DUF458 family)